jgi:microcystin-dependent protein
MAYSRRSYKGAAVSNALGGSGLAANATSITLAAAVSGWSTSGTPFFVVVDPGTAKEEKLCVIYASSTTLTVVDPAVTSAWSASVNGRGVDDTTDRAHDVGATIYPVFTATEANQANELVSKYTTNGDIVVHGTTGPKTISTGGSGNNNKVLVADSTVTDGGVKWGQIVEAGIADSAVTSAKIADGAIVNADINASAAIALSKLATGALPTDITVASANLVNGTVALADLATAVANALVPVGTIAMYGGAAAPTGWLLCDGASIDASYTGLRAIVGTTTPDFKGRFALGDNASLTLLATGGSTTIGTNNLPSHSHANTASASTSVSVSDPGHTHTINGELVQAASFNDNTVYVINADGQGIGSYTEGTASATTGITATASTSVTMSNANTGGAEAYFQPHVVVNYIIKHD